MGPVAAIPAYAIAAELGIGAGACEAVEAGVAGYRAGRAFGKLFGSVKMSGTCGYTFNESTKRINVRVEKIHNSRGGGSGSLKLDVWALKSFSATTGAILASYQLDPLQSNYSYNNLDLTLKYSHPQNSGLYLIQFALSEYKSGGSWKEINVFNFENKWVHLNERPDKIEFRGSVYYSLIGQTVKVTIEKILNPQYCRSGSIKVKLWAKESVGDSTGYVLLERQLNPLQEDYCYEDLEYTARFKRPPSGKYYLSLSLCQYSDGQYYCEDARNFSRMVSL